MTPPQSQPQKSDLPTRAASAIVMVAIAATALWLGGWFWTAFVAAVALGVLWEWWGLVIKFLTGWPLRGVWMVGGLIYVGLAAFWFSALRILPSPAAWTLLVAIIFAVICTDVGAYFAGRTFGGPKIAPKISPSKTWAGLLGGMVGASTALVLVTYPGEGFAGLGLKVAAGMSIAVVAQSGDFFESWMKRRAGVKDSSRLIPGHGGMFDRADGLLAVMFVVGLFSSFNFLAHR